MWMSVANERAGVRTPVVGNRTGTVGGDHVSVKIDYALPRDGRRLRSHAVPRMAGGAREPILLDVFRVPTEAAVAENLIQVVTLSA